MPKKHGGGKSRKGGKTREVVVVDPANKFNDALGMQGDSASLRGRELLTVALANNATVTAVVALAAQNLGGRCASLASVYSRYRFKEIIFRVFASGLASNNQNLITFGVMDDASGGEGDAPTSLYGVAQLRTAMVIPAAVQTPQVRTWKPADSKAWYYTYAGPFDPRLVYAGLVYIGGAATTVDIEIDFTISFKGAIDTGTSVTLGVQPTRTGELPDSAVVTLSDEEYSVVVPATNNQTGGKTPGTLQPVRLQPPRSALPSTASYSWAAR